MGLDGNEIPKGMDIPTPTNSDKIFTENSIIEFTKILNNLKNEKNISVVGYNINKDPDKNNTEFVFILKYKEV
jgi:hypothetical protein